MQNDEKCLTVAIYQEARGESQRGMQAVAQVILNRKNSGKYPPSVCNVVTQKNQFSWYNKNQRDIKKLKAIYSGDLRGFQPKDKQRYIQSKIIASSTLSGLSRGIPEIKDSLFFVTKGLRPPWSAKMQRKARIGNHDFY